MKYLPIFFFLIVGQSSFGQEENVLQQAKHFDQELRFWTNTFSNFRLSDFKLEDTLHFDNNFPQDFNSYKKFLSTYKRIITYLPDSSKFIDIYSYQLNLEKKENFYEATVEIDQAILLCNPKAKYWNSIYFGTSSQWIDEVVWISKTRFILVGIIKSEDYKKKPLILFGDTNKQILIKYLNINKNTFQSDNGYTSTKLKRININGL